MQLLLSCEHGGNRIPARYRPLFAGHDELLASHRGWDPGALEWARLLSHLLGAPLIDARISRLLVDLNRSLHHPALFSGFTRELAAGERELILSRHYLPHREKVETWIAQHARRGRRVLHVAVHSFTPVLDGRERNADIGLLYDPARTGERRLCSAWQAALAAHDASLRVRRNYPYRGDADGLTTHLRRRFSARSYLGIELEINQGLLPRPRRQFMQTIADALRSVTKLATRSQKL
jgi:predicted N-formylglutamate amidohydrolase